MVRIIVFDVNETLLDVQTLSPYFEYKFGDKNLVAGVVSAPVSTFRSRHSLPARISISARSI